MQTLKATASLLALLASSNAFGNTYYKCVDAKGSVTVQQTACAVTSSQEERKVWSSKAQPSSPANKPSSSLPRRPDESERLKAK